MRHITMTGYDAGLPICGVKRSEAAAKGDTFAHPGRWLDNPEIASETCPACRKLWDEAGEDDASEQEIVRQERAPIQASERKGERP